MDANRGDVPVEQSDGGLKTVGMGELRVTTNRTDVLVTHSLGSCIGLTLYDPARNIGGLVHCMIPVSRSDPERAARQPQLFTDSGVTNLLRAVFELGASRSSLVAKVSGAGNLANGEEVSGIGAKNYAVLRRILWRNSIFIAGEDIGGNVARSMLLDMATGQTIIHSGGRRRVL